MKKTEHFGTGWSCRHWHTPTQGHTESKKVKNKWKASYVTAGLNSIYYDPNQYWMHTQDTVKKVTAYDDFNCQNTVNKTNIITAMPGLKTANQYT